MVTQYPRHPPRSNHFALFSANWQIMHLNKSSSSSTTNWLLCIYRVLPLPRTAPQNFMQGIRRLHLIVIRRDRANIHSIRRWDFCRLPYHTSLSPDSERPLKTPEVIWKM